MSEGDEAGGQEIESLLPLTESTSDISLMPTGFPEEKQEECEDDPLRANDLVVNDIEAIKEHPLLCIDEEQQKRLIDPTDIDAPGHEIPILSRSKYKIPAQVYDVSCFLLWTIVFGLFAASISFWFPVMLIPSSGSSESINITSAIQNIIGSFVFGVVRSCSQVKYQYPQTYFAYKGIMCGFCSVFTTFANVVAETGRLLLTGSWYAAPVNIAGNLIFSIIAYEIGRQIARKLRKDVQFSDDTVKLENSEMRMHLEVEKQLGLQGDSDDSSDRHPLLGNRKKQSNSIRMNRGHYTVDELEYFRAQLASKKEQHLYKWFKWGHLIILLSLTCIILVNFVGVVLFSIYDENFIDNLPEWFPNSNNTFILTDFVIFAFFSLLGAISGSFFSGGKYDMMRSVQWGTFKVNMISCISIGCVNNITLFGSMFSISTVVTITFYRFIVGFCGSFSSFAGLIDETVVLFHGHTFKRRWNSLRNLFYNFFVCLSMYIIIILTVRLAIFLRYWSPASAVFLCGSVSLWSCFK